MMGGLQQTSSIRTCAAAAVVVLAACSPVNDDARGTASDSGALSAGLGGARNAVATTGLLLTTFSTSEMGFAGTYPWVSILGDGT